MQTGKKTYGANKEKELKNTKSIKDMKYHSGWVSYMLFWIFFIAISVVAVFVGQPKWYEWYDGMTMSSGATLCIFGLSFINRQKMSLKFKYDMKRLSKKLRIDYILFNNPKDEDYAENNIESFEDYEIYFDEKNKRTKIAFYIQFGFIALIFIVFLIISLVLK